MAREEEAVCGVVSGMGLRCLVLYSSATPKHRFVSKLLT